jgi:hypothetical protein
MLREMSFPFRLENQTSLSAVVVIPKTSLFAMELIKGLVFKIKFEPSRRTNDIFSTIPWEAELSEKVMAVRGWRKLSICPGDSASSR